jgi:hypothetical protein
MSTFQERDDQDEIYTQPAPSEEIRQGTLQRSSILIWAAVAIVSTVTLVIVAAKKGAFAEIEKKVSRMSFRSRASGQVYYSNKDYNPDGLGEARSFKPVNIKHPPPMKPEPRPPPDYSWMREPELPKPKPLSNWELMVEQDKLDTQGGEPLDPDDTKAERPLCVHFLEGSCRAGHQCRFRHDHDPLLPGAVAEKPTIATPGVPYRPKLNTLGEARLPTNIQDKTFDLKPKREGKQVQGRTF